MQCERERVGSNINWQSTLDAELSDSSSISEEISKKSAVSQTTTPQPEKEKLFKKKVFYFNAPWFLLFFN